MAELARMPNPTEKALVACWATPPHLLGAPPRLDTRWQRGSLELAHAEAFERRYGVMSPLSCEAQDVQHRWMLRGEEHLAGLEKGRDG